MSFFGAFTGSSERKAARNAQERLLQGQVQANNLLHDAGVRGRSDIIGGTNAAQSQLQAGYDTATGQISGAMPATLAELDAGLASANQGFGQARADIGSVPDYYGTLSDIAGGYNQAGQTYLGALGLGGDNGRQAAIDAFQAGPGYQFQVDQGIDAITRAANAGGIGIGGNLLQESQRFGQGLANQEYNSYLDRLGRAGEFGAGLEGQVAGARTNRDLTTSGRLADIAMQQGALGYQAGRDRAGVRQDTAGSLADLATGFYGSGANLYANQGRTLADLGLNVAGQRAGNIMQTAPSIAQYGTIADTANARAGGRLIDFGLDAAKTVAGFG